MRRRNIGERGHMLPVTLTLIAGLLLVGGALVQRPRIRAAIEAWHGHRGASCKEAHRIAQPQP